MFESANRRNAEAFLNESLERLPDQIRRISVENGSDFFGDFERASEQLRLELVTIPPHRPQRNG